ncbi:hypothetical protein PPERSA_01400 [Pseudocohnilembus persalinus]|uniref:Uncharacterized protein n=1 Tax=Pseudocohnilembus persalinus TaxID=266149 RepID=A0A0V0QH16_PSEPJ|nr:hypothetical protein PPERSA_01400 [Pseudocohnilembus persalinus]|eukprot:KRX01497.1 hypothetical protein PPERSA_01400 [Pseudocohnilembus persalinus]
MLDYYIDGYLRGYLVQKIIEDEQFSSVFVSKNFLAIQWDNLNFDDYQPLDFSIGSANIHKNLSNLHKEKLINHLNDTKNNFILNLEQDQAQIKALKEKEQSHQNNKKEIILKITEKLIRDQRTDILYKLTYYKQILKYSRLFLYDDKILDNYHGPNLKKYEWLTLKNKEEDEENYKLYNMLRKLFIQIMELKRHEEENFLLLSDKVQSTLSEIKKIRQSFNKQIQPSTQIKEELYNIFGNKFENLKFNYDKRHFMQFLIENGDLGYIIKNQLQNVQEQQQQYDQDEQGFYSIFQKDYFKQFIEQPQIYAYKSLQQWLWTPENIILVVKKSQNNKELIQNLIQNISILTLPKEQIKQQQITKNLINDINVQFDDNLESIQIIDIQKIQIEFSKILITLLFIENNNQEYEKITEIILNCFFQNLNEQDYLNNIILFKFYDDLIKLFKIANPNFQETLSKTEQDKCELEKVVNNVISLIEKKIGKYVLPENNSDYISVKQRLIQSLTQMQLEFLKQKKHQICNIFNLLNIVSEIFLSMKQVKHYLLTEQNKYSNKDLTYRTFYYVDFSILIQNTNSKTVYAQFYSDEVYYYLPNKKYQQVEYVVGDCVFQGFEKLEDKLFMNLNAINAICQKDYSYRNHFQEIINGSMKLSAIDQSLLILKFYNFQKNQFKKEQDDQKVVDIINNYFETRLQFVNINICRYTVPFNLKNECYCYKKNLNQNFSQQIKLHATSDRKTLLNQIFRVINSKGKYTLDRQISKNEFSRLLNIEDKKKEIVNESPQLLKKVYNYKKYKIMYELNEKIFDFYQNRKIKFKFLSEEKYIQKQSFQRVMQRLVNTIEKQFTLQKDEIQYGDYLSDRIERVSLPSLKEKQLKINYFYKLDEQKEPIFLQNFHTEPLFLISQFCLTNNLLKNIWFNIKDNLKFTALFDLNSLVQEFFQPLVQNIDVYKYEWDNNNFFNHLINNFLQCESLYAVLYYLFNRNVLILQEDVVEFQQVLIKFKYTEQLGSRFYRQTQRHLLDSYISYHMPQYKMEYNTLIGIYSKYYYYRECNPGVGSCNIHYQYPWFQGYISFGTSIRK